MSEPAAQTVRSFLHDLEEQRQIKILFAVESGSRAWRIESADSDYDVRFVYCRPLKDYVNLARPDDVINAAFDQKLAPCTAHDALYDLCGFDIFKFLRLLAKSNPSTIEWLISNVVYLGPVPPELRAFAEKSFDDGTLIRHYRSMAANNLREMEKRRTFTGKKYLYAFRGLLNAFCVAAFRRLPETDFTHTLETCRQTLGEETYAALSRLIESKKYGRETEDLGRQPLLDEALGKLLSLTETDARAQNAGEAYATGCAAGSRRTTTMSSPAPRPKKCLPAALSASAKTFRCFSTPKAKKNTRLPAKRLKPAAAMPISALFSTPRLLWKKTLNGETSPATPSPLTRKRENTLTLSTGGKTLKTAF